MDPSLKLPAVTALVLFLLGAICTEFLKTVRSPTLPKGNANSDERAAFVQAEDRARQDRAWLGLVATLCDMGQLVMVGWIIAIASALIQRP